MKYRVYWPVFSYWDKYWKRNCGRRVFLIWDNSNEIGILRTSIQVTNFYPFNPFHATGLFQYHLKTYEKLTIFWCFQGVEKGYTGNEWVNSQLIYHERFHFKVGLSTSKKNVFICFNKSSLKMMTNASCFISKPFLYLLLPWRFDHAGKRLDKKAKVKFMTSKIRQQKIAIIWEILSLKIHTQNVVENLVADPFIKNWNWVYL